MTTSLRRSQDREQLPYSGEVYQPQTISVGGPQPVRAPTFGHTGETYGCAVPTHLGEPPAPHAPAPIAPSVQPPWTTVAAAAPVITRPPMTTYTHPAPPPPVLISSRVEQPAPVVVSSRVHAPAQPPPVVVSARVVQPAHPASQSHLVAQPYMVTGPPQHGLQVLSR